MNPLSDIGMPDSFWEKFRKKCSKIQGDHPECECGSGLPITVNYIPLKTTKGIVWAGGFIPGHNCLACDTRRLWKVAGRAAMFFDETLIKPSDVERSKWTSTTRKYVEVLEQFYDNHIEEIK